MIQSHLQFKYITKMLIKNDNKGRKYDLIMTLNQNVLLIFSEKKSLSKTISNVHNQSKLNDYF